MNTLQPDPQFKGHLTLIIDGGAKLCPFQQPIGTQGTIQGQVQLIYRPCGTWCALFKLERSELIAGDDTMKAEINCGAEVETYFITTQDKPKENGSHIIEK